MATRDKINVGALIRERDEARAFGEKAARLYNDLLAEGRVLRCAFCDAEYPVGTPPTQHEALEAHVRICPAHPMRETERERDEARAVLRKYVNGCGGGRNCFGSRHSVMCDEIRRALGEAPEERG